MTSTPDPIDVRVGGRVRDLRIARGHKQSHLARALGLTFQQVQKYESGANRISCSKLAAIADCLGVTPAWFFDPPADGSTRDTPPPMPVAVPSRMLRALPDISGPNLRLLADLAVSMAAQPATPQQAVQS